MSKDKKIYASWHVSLNVDCPGCKKYVDLIKLDDFWLDHPNLQIGQSSFGYNGIFNLEVECPECGHKFKVDLEY